MTETRQPHSRPDRTPDPEGPEMGTERPASHSDTGEIPNEEKGAATEGEMEVEFEPAPPLAKTSSKDVNVGVDLDAATESGLEVVAEPEPPPSVRVTPARRQTTPPEAPVRDSSPSREPAGADDRLVLPRGAWIAMRKSGGLLFRSRDIVIYPNGQVTTSAVGGGQAERSEELPRLLPADLAALRSTVRRTDFSRLPRASGQQRSDAIAYELAIASNRATYQIEFTTGTIPKPLSPLVDHLNRIMAAGERE